MANLASLLLLGAEEIRRYVGGGWEQAWLERLATRMEWAAQLTGDALEEEVAAIQHSLFDSGPSDESACPSFFQVIDYFQRQRKRLRKLT